MNEARSAFNSYQREQHAPAGAEAPPGGYGGGSQYGSTVTCQSVDNKYQYCRRSIGTNARVSVQKRLSDSHCDEGRSWGYDADGVWVDKGCRAIFEIH